MAQQMTPACLEMFYPPGLGEPHSFFYALARFKFRHFFSYFIC